MASSHRYFILDEGCSSIEISKMMCRVVADKRLPLFRFAPVEKRSVAGAPPPPTHNSNDIIRDILPPPSRTTSRKELVAATRDKSLQLTLGSILGLDLALDREQRVELEAAEVKRYALNNPAEVFRMLMDNELYAKDVRALLEASTWGKAWLVIGFLTTAGATWDKTGTKRANVGINLTAPIAEVFGIPSLPGLELNPGIGFTHGKSMETGSVMVAPDEEIFAVAYAEVQIKYMLGGTGFTKVEKVGPAKRAKAHHLAFAHSDDDESEEEEDYDEHLAQDNEGKGNCQAASHNDIVLSFDYNDLETALEIEA